MKPLSILSAVIVLVASAMAQPPSQPSSRPQPPPGLEEQPADFTVNPATTYQTIEGFGAGFFPQTLMAASDLKPDQRERMYDLLYTDQGVRLNILRIHISDNVPLLPQGDPSRAKGLKYNWAKDPFTRRLFQALPLVYARVKKPILYAAPFTPPPRWKADKKAFWGGAVLPEHYGDYAEYLADFLKYCKQEQHANIDVLSLQNEPDVAASWESARWTGEELRDFLKILAAKLKAEGLSTKLMAPEGSNWDQTAIKIAPILEDPEARPLVGVLASHSYVSIDLVDRGRGIMQSIARSSGLPLWTSEMCIMGPPDNPAMPAAMNIAHCMYRDFVEADVSAWIYCFAIARVLPESPGSMGVLSPPKDGALVIPKRFWAFANYSRFVQPGWKRMQVEGLAFANTGFVSPQGDRFALVALNGSGRPRPARYDFGASTPMDVETFRTSKEEDLASVSGARVEGNALRVLLPPTSVTTFVGRLK
ncbi:MAG: hypothetical protein NTW86_03235 [Candidatus Sumerlaeota bacterium]|nr:hypothetical protein [Candidatus Sumerlaeota bacterium]